MSAQTYVKTVSKSQALAMVAADSSLRLFPFYAGKFKWLGSQAAHRVVYPAMPSLKDTVKAVYFERRTDKHGAYCKFMAVSVK